MPAIRASKSTLRTKTGCLTCRARRKKCNEQKPSCEKCTKSGRVCAWPNESDLFDRRHRHATRSPSLGSRSPDISETEKEDLLEFECSPPRDMSPFMICREISIASDLINSDIFHSDLELECFRQFLGGFLPPLILSTSHPGFHSNYVPEIVQMITDFRGLKNVVLACGATRMYNLNGSLEMNAAEIKFYSQAVSEVNCTLNKIDWNLEGFDDAVLMTVIFLYIHGLFSIRTNKDVQHHVLGAIQLMNIRSVQSRKPPMARPIHRIIWESILYQTFRQTVRHPFTVDFEPDLEFCAKAKQVLESLTFPDASIRDNSPVIGVPLDLQALIFQVVQLSKSSHSPDPEVVRRLTEEMMFWEESILDEGYCSTEGCHIQTESTSAGKAEVFHAHSTSLHILAASLLLSWVTESREVLLTPNSRLPQAKDSWQLRRAFQILRCPQASEEWSKCYLGSWPSLVFGYAVDKVEEVAVIRHDLLQRIMHLFCGEDLLLLDELEDVWRRRGISEL